MKNEMTKNKKVGIVIIITRFSQPGKN